MSRLILPQCSAIEHTDVGHYPFRCDLDAGHDGPHQHTFDVGIFNWSDTDRATVTDIDVARFEKFRQESG